MIFQKRSRGFTLIELLIVIAVLATVLVVSVSVLTSQRQAFNLEKDVLSFKDFIKECQSFSDKYSVPIQLEASVDQGYTVFTPRVILVDATVPCDAQGHCRQLPRWGVSVDRGRASFSYGLTSYFRDGKENAVFVPDGPTIPLTQAGGLLITLRPHGVGAFTGAPVTDGRGLAEDNINNNKDKVPVLFFDKKRDSYYVDIKGGGDVKLYKGRGGKYSAKPY